MATNVNKKHKDSLSFHERLGLGITRAVGTMWCAYVFACLALVSLPAAISGGVGSFITWTAQTFLQLVLLSIIMVGQNVQSRHSELRADEDYQVNMRAERENVEILRKLDEILKKKK